MALACAPVAGTAARPGVQVAVSASGVGGGPSEARAPTGKPCSLLGRGRQGSGVPRWAGGSGAARSRAVQLPGLTDTGHHAAILDGVTRVGKARTRVSGHDLAGGARQGQARALPRFQAPPQHNRSSIHSPRGCPGAPSLATLGASGPLRDKDTTGLISAAACYRCRMSHDS